MRELVKIVTVDKISPIKGADFIELAHIGGWQCVVKKGEFNPDGNDRGVFYEIDSFLPYEDERYAFLRGRNQRILNGKEGMRIKSMRLRKCLSQGLLLPLNEFSEEELKADDLAKALDVVKWELPIPAQLRGQMRRYFPSFIHKTDQERAQNCSKAIKNRVGELFEVTTKLDGSSCSIYHNNGDIGVCSRNIELKLFDDKRPCFKKGWDWLLLKLFNKKPVFNKVNTENTFVKTAWKSGLLDALANGEFGNICVQGELLGPNIQKNREGLEDHQFFVFDIWDIDKQRYMTPKERWRLFSTLELYSDIKHVPVVDIKFVLNHTIEELLVMADGPSLNHPIREGLVFKHMDGGFSFKAVSNKFLLKEED